MPITISIEKKDEHGNKYYVDEEGNRLEEENEEYRYLNKEYVDYVNSLTEEDLARQRAEGAARADARIAAKKRAATPFLLRPLVPPQPAKPRLPLWGDYWYEREFCVMVGDTGVGKSLLALKVAKQIVMQNVTPPKVDCFGSLPIAIGTAEGNEFRHSDLSESPGERGGEFIAPPPPDANGRGTPSKRETPFLAISIVVVVKN